MTEQSQSAAMIDPAQRALAMKQAEDPLYGEAETGVELGGRNSPIPKSTLRYWRQTGQGPRFLKVGRLIRYRYSDLMAFKEAAIRQSTSETVD